MERKSLSSQESIALERLPDALRMLACDGTGLQRYSPGTLIMSRRTGGDQIRFLVSGQASLVLRDDDGEKIAVDTLGPHDIFGEVSFFTGLPWPSDAELWADTLCQIIEIPAEDFELLIRLEPDFAVTLVKNLVRKIIRLDRAIFRTKVKRRALQNLISREEHIFSDYVVGDYVRRHLFPRVEELARTDEPALIIGESGVGKESLAHTIFRKSHHCKEVFLQVNLLRSDGDGVTEIPETPQADTRHEVTEKQLRLFFGYEEPGPDGGTKEASGYFELTEDGTLLVRGVDQLTPVVQMKLLEAIVTDTFRRCGSVRLQKAKVRLIATSRIDPSQITLERHPLLYALLLQSMHVPPLRTRRREIPRLVDHFLKKYSREMHRDVGRLPKESVKTLVNYAWPGNDLELSTTLKRAVMVCEDGVIRPQDIYFDLRRIEGRGKINLLKFARVRKLLMSPLFPAVLQSAAVPFLFLVMIFLFLGPSDPVKNPAAVISWAVGWPVLIIGAFIFARFWCSLCPIGTIGNLAKKILALEKPFPAFLKNRSDFLVAGAVLFVLWFEHVTQIRNSPATLGLLLLAMLASAVLASVIFERQSWCLYLCGLGGMMGVLAKSAIVELRADRNVCISQCGSNECYVGGSADQGCPYGQAGPRLHSNRVCKLCTSCIKNCPHGAINLNLRIPGRELWEIRQPNTGTAFLVVGMMGALLSEMITKSALYSSMSSALPFPNAVDFSVVFMLVIALATLSLALAATISRRVYKESFRGNFARYGLALLPLALTSFTAYHMYYFVTLGAQLPVLASNFFDIEALKHLSVTLPEHYIRAIQQGLVATGLVWTLLIIYRIGSGSHPSLSKALAGILPHALLAVVLALIMTQAMGSFFFG
jgi:transcriptional regulator with AAA-type ATPase domain/polyferredoxin